MIKRLFILIKINLSCNFSFLIFILIIQIRNEKKKSGFVILNKLQNEISLNSSIITVSKSSKKDLGQKSIFVKPDLDNTTQNTMQSKNDENKKIEKPTSEIISKQNSKLIETPIRTQKSDGGDWLMINNSKKKESSGKLNTLNSINKNVNSTPIVNYKLFNWFKSIRLKKNLMKD